MPGARRALHKVALLRHSLITALLTGLWGSLVISRELLAMEGQLRFSPAHRAFVSLYFNRD